MKFQVIDKELHIECENARDVVEAVKHFNFDIAEHAEAIANGALSIVRKSSRQNNGAWFECEYTTQVEYLRPYFDKLKQITGYCGELPTIDAPCYERKMNLCYTHIVDHAQITPEGFKAHGFIESQDWHGKTAQERAPVQFREYIVAEIGDTKHEREFIELDSGLLKRNPNYLKRHYPHAALANRALWACLWAWWFDTFATDEQKAIIKQTEDNHRTVCKTESLSDFLMRSYENGFRTTWGNPLISFDQFQKMGA